MTCSDTRFRKASFFSTAHMDKMRCWTHLPKEVQSAILEKKLHFYVIDAGRVAREAGMGGRINTIMQTCFFAIFGVLPRDEAIARIKDSIRKTYGKKGEEVVNRNCAAVDKTLENIYEVWIAGRRVSAAQRPPIVPEDSPDLVKRVLACMMRGEGDSLPVSALPPDGTWPTGTTKWEKPQHCLRGARLGSCSLRPVHAMLDALSPRDNTREDLRALPAGRSAADLPVRAAALQRVGEKQFTIQVAAEDCTGCGLCAVVCPAKNKGTRGVRPSIWSRRPRCGSGSGRITISFLAFPTSTAQQSTNSMSGHRSM